LPRKAIFVGHLFLAGLRDNMASGQQTNALATETLLPVDAELSLDLSSAKIAIIDDEPLNVRIIRHQLEKLGYRFLLGLSDPLTVLESLNDFRPDVVLMDVVMPGLSGIELLGQMREHPRLQSVPAITLTASRDRATRLQILQLGVADFLNKPVDEVELSTRLRNVIEAKRYRDNLKHAAWQLERAVRQRTAELEASRREVVLCLARAAEYRDDSTGRHVIRVGRYAGVLARAMGLGNDYVEMIQLAAQLHDVGKIGIPDVVLHKPGRLTAEEMDVMRCHADYGRRIVGPLAERNNRLALEAEIGGIPAVQSPMLEMAARIAGSHHERWDGKGYPCQLQGEQIPLEARITAVADVFDALSTARCYKPAFPLDECFQMVAAERGQHFDPEVADACLRCRPEFVAIHRELVEEAAS
jgi:putative two-component system response regulator